MNTAVQNTGKKTTTGNATSTLYHAHLVDQVAATLLDDDAFLQQVRYHAVSASTDLLLQRLRPGSDASDPYDSIYISDLEPDTVTPATAGRVLAVRSLVDCSNEISIPDED